MMLRRIVLAALLTLAPSLALAQTNAPDFSVAAYVRYVLSGNVTIGGNLTIGGILFDTGGIAVNSPTGGNKGPGTINVAADYYKNGTIIPETVSLPLALSAGGNVSCPTCVLISGTAHGDSAYAILSTDRYVYTNAAFTAPRTWTLPAANSLSAGTTIWVQDAQGTVTTTNTLTVQRAGADTVNVTGTNIVMTGAGGGTQFTTDGVSNWGTAVQTVTTGGTGRQTLTNHGLLVGAGTNPLTQLGVAINGQLLLGATGLDPAFAAMSQDCTITAAGVISCTKTNNVAFGALATTVPGTGVATAAASAVNTSGGLLTYNPAGANKMQVFTGAGTSGTITTPTGAAWAKFTITGTGGGGSGGGTATGGTGTSGGNTCINTSGAACTSPVYQAGGGGGGNYGTGVGGAGGTIAGSGSCSFSVVGGGGFAETAAASTVLQSGAGGGASFFGGAGAGAYNNSTGISAAANSGSGGQGGGSGASGNGGAGGGAGATCIVFLQTPAASYTYAIGSAGTGGTAGTGGSAGGAGGSGVVMAEYGFN